MTARPRLYTELLEKHDGVEVLVNNAGCGHSGSALDGDPEQW
jgi:short-subunit dehydrogenase